MHPKEILQELVDAILESKTGKEIDAGYNCEGPLATAMVYLGMAQNTYEASDLIFEGE